MAVGEEGAEEPLEKYDRDVELYPPSSDSTWCGQRT